MASKRDRVTARTEYEKKAAGLRRERAWFWALSLVALVSMVTCNAGAAAVRKYPNIEGVHGWGDLLGNAASPASVFTLAVGVIPPVLWVLAAVCQTFTPSERPRNLLVRYAPLAVVLGAFAVSAWCTYQFVLFVGLPEPLAAAFPLFLEIGCAWSTAEVTTRNALLEALETERLAEEGMEPSSVKPQVKPASSAKPAAKVAPSSPPATPEAPFVKPAPEAVPAVRDAFEAEDSIVEPAVNAPSITAEHPDWMRELAAEMETASAIRGKTAEDLLPIIHAIDDGYSNNRLRDEGLAASSGTAQKVREAVESYQHRELQAV